MKLLKLLKYSEKDPVYILTGKTSLEEVKKEHDVVWDNVWDSLPHDRFYIETLLPTSNKEAENIKNLDDFVRTPFLILVNGIQKEVSSWVELPDSKSVCFSKFINITAEGSNVTRLLEVDLKKTSIPHKMTLIDTLDIGESISGSQTLWTPTKITVIRFLETLRDKETRLANTTKSYKIEKKKYNTVDVTYVSNIKYLQSKNCEPQLRNMDWTFSWLRAGHWRKIDPGSIGKDRNGDRTQRGRTWVVEATCNDGLPLRVLPRIVQ